MVKVPIIDKGILTKVSTTRVVYRKENKIPIQKKPYAREQRTSESARKTKSSTENLWICSPNSRRWTTVGSGRPSLQSTVSISSRGQSYLPSSVSSWYSRSGKIEHKSAPHAARRLPRASHSRMGKFCCLRSQE